MFVYQKASYLELNRSRVYLLFTFRDNHSAIRRACDASVSGTLFSIGLHMSAACPFKFLPPPKISNHRPKLSLPFFAFQSRICLTYRSNTVRVSWSVNIPRRSFSNNPGSTLSFQIAGDTDTSLDPIEVDVVLLPFIRQVIFIHNRLHRIFHTTSAEWHHHKQGQRPQLLLQRQQLPLRWSQWRELFG